MFDVDVDFDFDVYFDVAFALFSARAGVNQAVWWTGLGVGRAGIWAVLGSRW